LNARRQRDFDELEQRRHRAGRFGAHVPGLAPTLDHALLQAVKVAQHVAPFRAEGGRAAAVIQFLAQHHRDLAPVWWFLRSLRGSRRQEGSSPEQIQAGSAVHLTLEQFEAIDLPLSLPAAPWQCECRPNCSAILFQTGSKRLNRRDTASVNGIER